MDPSPDFERPDAAVAAQIVARFVDEGILPQSFAQRTSAMLAAGSVRSDEWRRLAEQVLDWEMQEAEHER